METQKTQTKLVNFFILSFVISWLLWLAPLLRSNDLIQLPEFTEIFGMFAPFGPFIAAFWLTRQRGGQAGTRSLWKRGWSLNFDKKWLIPTILLMPVAGLVTIAVLTLMGQSIQWEFGISFGAAIPTFIIIYLVNALPEEYGWRGYALEPMQTRFNALTASLMLGAIWGLWHLPLHFIEGTVQANIPVYQFILQQMVLAVFYTWLFNNTKGSVFIAILFHTIANLAGAALPYWITDQGRWVGFFVQLLFAITIILVWGPQRLGPSPSNEPGSRENE
ncbi:MAG TPA: CPBP family intramembrane glutamic endopeptidase [Anaerolineales bacterium]|nr:CPBP family intramembrane glutamic endopeptidase [Anaerolineales bacterium]